MQEMIYLIYRFHYVENVIKFEVAKCSSQYENEEVESHVSSDDNKVVDLTYYEEISCEDNDESCGSIQEEDSGHTCLSSYKLRRRKQ